MNEYNKIVCFSLLIIKFINFLDERIFINSKLEIIDITINYETQSIFSKIILNKYNIFILKKLIYQFIVGNIDSLSFLTFLKILNQLNNFSNKYYFLFQLIYK